MTDEVVVRAHAPGRVNLIGDHTDYAGGLALPCAIDLGTTITATRGGSIIELSSDTVPGAVRIDLDHRPLMDDIEPSWGRYVAGVIDEWGRPEGLHGSVTSTLPPGAGLSSSAALVMATAAALGFDGPRRALARFAQRAEERATGVPIGLLDQLAIAFGRQSHALLIDFDGLAIDPIVPIPVPDHLDIVVVHSGEQRTLVGSAYAERRESCRRAVELVGFLPTADPAAIDSISDDILRRRARHVATECARVRAAAIALRQDDATTFGTLMVESHRSLRDDFEVSTPGLDALVDRLVAMPGVHGARLTGAGFGGCVVALAERDAISDPSSITGRGWIVVPSDRISIEVLDRQ
jgi:galactokinase